MTRLYRHPIEVKTNPKGLPIEFSWRSKWYHVMDCTIKEEFPSRFQVSRRDPFLPRYRCSTKQGLVCDLILKDEGWLLERVWD